MFCLFLSFMCLNNNHLRRKSGVTSLYTTWRLVQTTYIVRTEAYILHKVHQQLNLYILTVEIDHHYNYTPIYTAILLYCYTALLGRGFNLVYIDISGGGRFL